MSLIAALALLMSMLMATPAQATVSINESPVTITMATGKTCPANVKNRPTLQIGSRGACVNVLQQLLLNKGYNIGSAAPDGWFGPKTRIAVRNFQEDHRLKPDMIVGPITWGALTTTSSKKVPPKKSAKQPAVLTFDDCPYGVPLATTNATLKAAKSMGIHLRLYPTGDCLAAKRLDVAYARSMGHTVCSHSNHHWDLRSLSLAGVKKEMTLKLPNGKKLSTNCARPPYGATNATVKKAFAQLGYSHDLWDVDTKDWKGKSQSQIVSSVITYAKPGDVVLMHMNHKAFNKTAIRQIKEGLAKRGIAIK